MRNYTTTGFAKIKAPEAVFSLVKEFWDNNKNSLINEWSHSTPYHNIWEAPTSVIRIDNSSLIGGGQQLYARIADAARDAMEVNSNSIFIFIHWKMSISSSQSCFTLDTIQNTHIACLVHKRHGLDNHNHQHQFMVSAHITTKAY
jgi:hypothetical protein